MTQKQEVIDWMKRTKSITALEAMLALNIYRLAARILELRQDGWEIETVMEPHEGGEHARYFLKRS